MNEEQMKIADIMRGLAPALKKVSDQTMVAWIMLAEMYVCANKFGTKYNQAVALYAMHLMFLDGAMKGENESIENYSRRMTNYSLSGEFSMSYGNVSNNNTGRPIYDTPWGKMYDILNKKKGGGFGLISGIRGCGR